MNSFWYQFGGLSGALAVSLGAFGAHGLKGRLDARGIENWNTAAHYHLIHSLAIVASAVAVPHPINWSARLFSVGVGLFSGSLYALVLTDQKKLGIITPIGGTALIAGWIALAARK